MGGTSSKSTFSELVHALLTKDIDTNDHEFWDELWKTVLTVEEIFEVISADDMRQMINLHPENLRTIFTQAVAQLYQVVETPYPIYFNQALNCTRILSRMLPILLEITSQITHVRYGFVKELLWSKRVVKNLPQEATTNTTTIEGAEDGEETKEVHGNGEGDGEVQESEPLAVILVNTMYHLLFLPDFTVEDPSVDFNENDINTTAFKSALMWAPGVGSVEKTVTASTQFDLNRVEILRLMIATFSDSLYQQADHYDSCASMWLEVATSVDAPYAEIVFYSLMNTVLGYDPIGWGVPYGNLVATDTAKVTMEAAIQTLIILLDYGHPIKYDSTPAQNIANLPYVSSADTQTQGFNVFRRFLGSIEDPDQLNFIFQGFVTLLNNVHQSESTYLPYSVTRIGIEQELLILFWKCLDEIPKFMPYILKYCDINELLVPICYFMLEGRKDPSKVGLMYLCTFTLLKLSGERNFGVALNKSYQLRLPVDVPLFSGNHADLLVIVLHKMIVSGLEKLSALYSCFLTIICNVSPYCKSLCTVSAVKLVNLFQLFVSPKFLYAAEGNHVYVGLLLETFNNIVQYQYEGNGNLIYAIVRRKDAFESLASLTLPVAIKHAKEMTEKKPATKAKVVSGDANTTGADKKADEHENVVVPTTAPTDLISTQNVERRLGAEGEVVDVKSPEADSRTPTSPHAKETQKKHKAGKGSQAEAPVDSHQQHTSNNAHPARFTPTEEWLTAVKAELPLNTIMRLLKHLAPQIDEMSREQTMDEKQVVDFLRSTTMVGLLPVPHPIVIRKYQPNRFTCLWLTAFQWGVVFMHNQTLPLFDGSHVKLFIVQTV